MPPERSTRVTGSTRCHGSGRSKTARSTGSSSASPSSTGRSRTARFDDLAHAHLDVGERAPREILALLVRDDLALGPDGAQERQRQRARPHPRLEHVRAREDVGPEENHREVLRVDDLGAARHVEHVLGQRRAQRETARALRGAHPRAVGLADDVLVLDPPAVGVEGLTLSQQDEMALAALVDQQRLLAILEAVEETHGWAQVSACAARAASGTAHSPGSA